MSPALLAAERELSAEVLRRRVRASLERDAADLVLANCRLVNVYSEEIHQADIVLHDGAIVAIREGYTGDAVQRIDCAGRLALPGLVQAAIPGTASLTGVLAGDGVTTVFGAGDPLPLPLRCAARTSTSSTSLRGGRDGEGVCPRQLVAGAREGVIGAQTCATAEQVLTCTRVGQIAVLAPPTRDGLIALLASLVERAIDLRHVCLSAVPDGSVTLLEAIGLAVAAGIPTARAVQLASLFPAMHESVDHLLGSVTPGRRGDVVVVDDLGEPRAVLVTFEGRVILGA